MIRRYLWIILLLFAVPCYALNPFQAFMMSAGAGGATAPTVTMKQKLISGYTGAINPIATRYIAVQGNGVTPSATEASFIQLLPTGGTIRKLYVMTSAAPDNGAGTQSFTMTLRKGSGAGDMADTALTCVISETATNCSDAAHEVTVAADDKVSISIASANTPVSTALISTMVEFESSTANEAIMMTNYGLTLPAGTRYLVPHGNNGNSAETIASIVMPCAGTITSFYGRLTAAPSDGTPDNGRTFTIRLNAGDATGGTALTFGEDDVALSASQNISVAVGDRISITSAITQSPAAASFYGGILFKPTTNGEFPIRVGGPSGTIASGVTQYHPIGSSEYGAVTTETLWGIGLNDFAITGATGWLNVNPGAGKTFTMTLRKATGPADTDPNFEISFTNEVGPNSVTGSLTPTTNEGYGVEYVSGAGATATYPLFSVKGYISP